MILNRLNFFGLLDTIVPRNEKLRIFKHSRVFYFLNCDVPLIFLLGDWILQKHRNNLKHITIFIFSMFSKEETSKNITTGSNTKKWRDEPFIAPQLLARTATSTIIRRFLSKLVGMTSLDKNYWEVINLSFVSTWLQLNILENWENVAIWDKKVLYVRGTSFQREKLNLALQN